MSEGRDLRITQVELSGFRSYDSFVLRPGRGLTVIVGPNASGKTNLLEAVHLTTSGVSFRGARAEDLVERGAERARLTTQARADDGSEFVVEMTAEEGSRRYRVNGKPLRRRSDLSRRLPAVVFTPEDLAIVKGPAERRRDALDDMGEGLSSAYGALRRDYSRTLRQRNALLREGARAGELEPWTEQIASIGARLATHRAALLNRLAKEVEEVYREISAGEELAVCYEDSYRVGGERWREGATPPEVEGAILRRLAERAAEEIRRQITLAGPHRDDVSMAVRGSDARTRASQGQQRTLALAWRIAELRVVREVTGRRPVLLLDDVMSELDESRREALTRHVGEGLQTLLTATTLDYFPAELLDDAVLVRTGAQE